MFKKALFFTLFLLNGFFSFNGIAQKPLPSPQESKLAWQRLLLQLSSTYYTVARESQVDLDSSLIYASRSLGLSRIAVLAEGIRNEELLARSQWVDTREPGKAILQLAGLKGMKRLELLVLLGSYYAFQPDSYHRYRDSVEYFLKMVMNESHTTDEKRLARIAACLLGKVYLQGADLVNGNAMYDQVIRDCQIAGDRETEARAFAYRGIYTALSPATVQNRITDLQKSRDIYRELNDHENQVNILTDMGYLNVLLFRLENASEVFLEALHLADSISFPYTQYNTDALAMSLEYQNKFGESLRYTIETIKTVENNRDSIGSAFFYARLGGLYHIEGDRDSVSLIWLEKAMDRFILDKNAGGLYLCLSNITDILFARNQFQQALDLLLSVYKKLPPDNPSGLLYYHMELSSHYIKLRQFKLAELHIREASRLEKEMESLVGPFRSTWVTYQYGRFYFYDGQYVKSKSYLEKYLSDPSAGAGNLLQKIFAYKLLIQIDSALHDPVSGLAHYKKYTSLLDSNFRASKLRQAEELQVKYLTQEKENQIAVLNQKAALEQANLSKARMVKNITITGTILVIIIGTLLYLMLFKQNQIKQKSNVVITRKNEELQHLVSEREWLLKEVHHRVKNNLHTIICLLESQAIYLENDALQAIEKSQHRIYAMSLIHQKLYQNEDLRSIDMSVYLEEFISYLKDSFDVQKIDFKVQVEPVQLNLQQAIPVALIINEGVTNAIKYAFSNENSPTVLISMTLAGEERVKLVIADNGKGFEMKEGYEGKSLGMQLIKGLSKELKGTVQINAIKGTRLTIEFPKEPITDQIPVPQEDGV